MSIHNIYPITNFESDKWKEKLDLLKQTNIKINYLIGNLNQYIKGGKNDFDF